MHFASKDKDKQMTPDSVKSADRVLDLLEFICRRGSASHAEISIALGIPKSSLTHLLRNLVARRYLDLSDGTNMFELGEGFFGLLKTGLVGRDAAKLLITAAREAEARGAGEILLQSIDRDGTGRGYDVDVIRSVADATSVPLIVCGGVGRYEHYVEGVQAGGSTWS